MEHLKLKSGDPMEMIAGLQKLAHQHHPFTLLDQIEVILAQDHKRQKEGVVEGVEGVKEGVVVVGGVTAALVNVMPNARRMNNIGRMVGVLIGVAGGCREVLVFSIGSKTQPEKHISVSRSSQNRKVADFPHHLYVLVVYSSGKRKVEVSVCK